MLLFIRLAVEEGRPLQHIHFASAGTTSGIPASFLYRNQKEGKERGRGKIGIITHVRTYMRT
jgi:hypothetical protein